MSNFMAGWAVMVGLIFVGCSVDSGLREIARSIEKASQTCTPGHK